MAALLDLTCITLAEMLQSDVNMAHSQLAA